MRAALVNSCGRCAVDQQAKQFRPTIMAAQVHQLLALVDQREIEVSDDQALVAADRVHEQASIGGRDRGEVTAGDRINTAASVLDDLRLLLGIQLGGSADDETRRLQCMLPDVDLNCSEKSSPKIEPGYIAE